MEMMEMMAMMQGKGKGKGELAMMEMMLKGKGKGAMAGLFGRGGFHADEEEDDDEDESGDGEDSEGSEGGEDGIQKSNAGPCWEIDLDSHWAPFDPELAEQIAAAEAAGETIVQ